MPNLNITEFAAFGRDASTSFMPIAQLPAVTIQNVTFTSSSVQSAAVGSSTGLVRVRADAACAILVGTNPTALVTSTMLDPGAAEYFSVPIGASIKIAVIAI